MVELLPSCHFSARRHRLDCLYLLIVHVSNNETEQRRHAIISSFLKEIILGLKETNKKTRNKAYDTLVQIGHIYGDEEKGGTKENLHQLFNMVAGGLAGETPVIISAAMRGLARLAYEFSDLVSTASNLLPSTFLLLQGKNREIIKASLCLLKVLVAKSQAEGLQLHLKSMVESLLKWQDDTKTNFKAKVNLLLEMLVRKCGLDAVKAVMPPEHMKLLTHIRKIKERKERKQHASKSEEAKSLASKATTARLSRRNHSKVFSDFVDEETDDYMDAQRVTGRRGKASRLKSKACSLRLVVSSCSMTDQRFDNLSPLLYRPIYVQQIARMFESVVVFNMSRSKSGRTNNKKLLADHLLDQLEEEPLGLLDGPRTMSALGSLKRKMESDEEPEIDPDGRLIIGEEANSKPSHPDSDARSEAAGTKKIRKRRKTSENRWASSGNVYGSNKAGVDLKKKDKLFEPYAYWALDRKMMSARPEHRAAARKGIASILSSKRFKFKRVHKKKIN